MSPRLGVSSGWLANSIRLIVTAGRGADGPRLSPWPLLVASLPLLAVGCGTTRMTDTQRTATEQLLVSNAIDSAVSEIDFRALSEKTVFFDSQYLDTTVDKGYLVSTIRQQLLASGCRLQDERAKADFIVEVRSGSVGTDRHALLVGVPQMTVPAFLPGQPSQIPEIPFAKKTDQEGVAKIAVFAYNRLTGEPAWQSGLVQAVSTSKDTWFLGAGPFQQGTIRKGTEFAGEMILPHAGTTATKPDDADDLGSSLTEEMTWLGPLTPKTDSNQLARLLGAIPVADRPAKVEPDTDVFPITVNPVKPAAPAEAPAPAPAPKPAMTPAPPLDPAIAAQLETEPSKLEFSGLHVENELQVESEPSKVLSSNMGFTPAN